MPDDVDILKDFVSDNCSEPKRQVLRNGLHGLRRIHANRAWEDWLTVLQAFTAITEDIINELKASGDLDDTVDIVDIHNVDTSKGSPFQRRFLPRWEKYEALLGGNQKPLTKSERANLRELVKTPAVLTWYNGLTDHRQRQLTHPNRVIAAWKAANRSGADEETKPSLAKTQQRVILDQELTETRQHIALLQSALEDHDWNAASEINDVAQALIRKLRSRSAREQAAVIRMLADDLGFGDALALLTRKPAHPGSAGLADLDDNVLWLLKGSARHRLNRRRQGQRQGKSNKSHHRFPPINAAKKSRLSPFGRP